MLAARQQTHLLESIRGMQSIRLFGRHGERTRHWLNILADQFNAELQMARLALTHQSANTLLFGAERIVVVWPGALAVLDHRFSIGMLFAFLGYKEQFTQRLSGLIDKLFEIGMLRLHGERVADILLAAPERVPASGLEQDGAPASAATPAIELRNISFRYSDSEPLVLSGLSLSVPAGQCLAITGRSGCGKTTLVKLLLGLLEPCEGEILVDGVPLGSLGLAGYRRLLGTVMQEDQLFAGSISDNIAFFDPAADQQRVCEAAFQAAIHDDINAMPMGYNTLVGDIGSGLSGGQKQRILLARALYRQPAILVLDEATSHLDLASERAVNAAIQNGSFTRILVAHRPDTIAMAQRVVVLEQGAIVGDTLALAAG